MVDAVKLISDLLKIIAKEQGYDGGETSLQPTSSGNANYSTSIYVATLSKPNKEDLKLFGKVAVFSKEFREEALEKYYVTEHMFFNDLIKRYETIQDKHNITGDNRLIFPKLYGMNVNFMEETMVFEDLGAKGFQCYNRFESVTWEYAAKAIQELAKFHAVSVAYGQENPDKYKTLLNDLEFVLPVKKHLYKKYYGGLVTAALEVTKEEYKEKLARFMEEYGDMDETKEFYAPLRCPAITHGDYKIANLLHRERKDGKLDMVILDYQTLRAGSTVSDLIYFIFTSTDRKFRQQYYQQLVDFYYAELRQALQRLGVDPDKVYPRDDFDYELKVVLPFGITVGVYITSALLVTDDDAPVVSGDLDLSVMVMKPNTLYGERLNEILEDYIQWGIL